MAKAAKKVSKKKSVAGAPVPPTFAPVFSVFAGDRTVSRRRMFSSENVLSVNGKIFAMLGRGWSLVVKLPKARVDELVSAGKGKHFDPGNGRLMHPPWRGLADPTGGGGGTKRV